MFSNRHNGRNNVVGVGIKKLRQEKRVSQRVIAELFQDNGVDVDKNAVQRMESGQRFITDCELVGIMKAFGVTYDELIKLSKE